MYKGGLNLYSYGGGDPINNVDPLGEDSFLVSRPVLVGGIPTGQNHSFVVIADRPGGTIQARFSFGPSKIFDGKLVNLVSAGLDIGTNQDDLNAFSALSNTDNIGVVSDRRIAFTRINAPDNVVNAFGEAVTSALGTKDNPGNTNYDTLPALSDDVNSNSAALAVSNGAINYGRATSLAPLQQPTPGRTNNPGAAQFGRVPIDEEIIRQQLGPR
jgi:hypothetical protein